MHIDGQVTMDRATYRRMVLSLFDRRGRAWLRRVVGALIVVVGALLLAVDPDVRSALLVLLGAAILLLPNVGPEIVVAIGWRRIRTLADQTFRYTVTDHSLSIRTPLTNADLMWDGVTSVRIRPQAWLIRGPGGGVNPVPRQAFKPEDQAEIDEFLKSQRFPRTATKSA